MPTPIDPTDPMLRYHERTRSKGVNRALLLLTHLVLRPLILLWFRLERIGCPHIPKRGGVLIAANHRSFLDPFVIACCARRSIYFVAKCELFEKRWQAWVLNRLGAFPVRRGESDEDMMATARALLERGAAVMVFPEGTRIRTGSLAEPRRGVGRLALETGVPVVPVAVIGSERARSGWLIKPAKVRIRCGRPLRFPMVAEPSPSLAQEVTDRIWPCVELQWEWLGGLPPLRKAAVIGAGAMGSGVAVLLARAGLEVQLGCRTREVARQIGEARENEEYLPGIALPDRVRPVPAPEIELAGVDLVVFAVPSGDLPAAVGQHGARIGDRSAVLVVSKGLVPPLATTPSRYVRDRVRGRAVAALGGTMHALDAVERGASVVLATEDEDFSRQLAEAFEAAGLEVERTDDVLGTELAGCAKNAAALAAAAAAEGEGMNAAGAAAGHVFSEVHELARRGGAREETFVGSAGVGDLVGTALADGSRNRRAGELIGRGVPKEQAKQMLNGAAEGLDFVPLLAEALERAGVDAPATAGLRDLIEGRTTPRDWIERVRGPKEEAAAA